MHKFCRIFAFLLALGAAQSALAGFPNSVDGSQAICDPQNPKNCFWPAPRGLTLSQTQVSITTGATLISAAGSAAAQWRGICNWSTSVPLYIGQTSGVTTSNASVVIGGGSQYPSCWNFSNYTGALYGITGSSATASYATY